MAAHRAAPTGAGTPGSATSDPGLASRVWKTQDAQTAVGKRLRRVVKMLDDVVNAVFHVGDAAGCELRGAKRTRGTRGGRNKDRRRAVEYSDGSSKTSSELPKEVKEWVAVVKPNKNMEKRRARQAEARARRAEEENRMLQQRLQLREKVGGEEVSVQDCLLLLKTEEFHRKPLDEVLQRLEARWLQASAAEKTWRDHVQHPQYGSDVKVRRAEEAIKRIESEYEAKLAGQEKQISDLREQL